MPVDDGTTGDAANGGDRGADRTVETYVGDPDRLDADASWPGDESFPACVRAYLARNDVVVRPRAESTFADFEGLDGKTETDAAADHDAWGIE